MRLVKLTEFRRMIFADGSAPALNTLRARIHEIPGGTVIAGRYYVDMDEFDRKTRIRDQIEERRQELAEKLKVAGLI